MPQQVINLGATGSGAGGDSARTAFEKAIANFAELYIAALPSTAAQKKAARDMFGLGPAAVAAILGTVSQSGGVPTGAIIERGSNANGEYVRFADGTQICWRSGIQIVPGTTQEFVTSTSYSYPASFISTPEFLGAMDGYPNNYGNSSDRYALVLNRDQGGNATRFALFRPSGAFSGGQVIVGYIAIGRWY